MTKTLVIDNYDSFTYNLVHFLGELGADMMVRRNDKTAELAYYRCYSPNPVTLADC